MITTGVLMRRVALALGLVLAFVLRTADAGVVSLRQSDSALPPDAPPAPAVLKNETKPTASNATESKDATKETAAKKGGAEEDAEKKESLTGEKEDKEEGEKKKKEEEEEEKKQKGKEEDKEEKAVAKRKTSHPRLGAGIIVAIALGAVVLTGVPLLLCCFCGCCSCINLDWLQNREDVDINGVVLGRGKAVRSSSRSAVDCRNSECGSFHVMDSLDDESDSC